MKTESSELERKQHEARQNRDRLRAYYIRQIDRSAERGSIYAVPRKHLHLFYRVAAS